MSRVNIPENCIVDVRDYFCNVSNLMTDIVETVIVIISNHHHVSFMAPGDDSIIFMNSSLDVDDAGSIAANPCLIRFYIRAAQDKTTQNYLCFVSYYIVFKVLVEKSRIRE